MFGRLGSLWYLHLVEAEARRHRMSRTRPRTDLAIFGRLALVLALVAGAAGLVSAMAGG